LLFAMKSARSDWIRESREMRLPESMRHSSAGRLP
jgi:hypothetical protein